MNTLSSEYITVITILNQIWVDIFTAMLTALKVTFIS